MLQDKSAINQDMMLNNYVLVGVTLLQLVDFIFITKR